MGAPTNTFQTYQSIGNREQLEDTIYQISPEDTPLMSNGGRKDVDGTFFEWQKDTLAAPNNANAQIEGFDVGTFSAVTPTTRVGNRTQISSKDLVISRTQERIKKAGRKSELARQLTKRSAELKIDMESIAFQNQVSDAGSSSTARKTGALLNFLYTNTDFGAGGANPVYTTEPNSLRTDGTQRNITEVLLKVVIAKAWTSGGKPRLVSFGASNKQNASQFSGIAQIRKAVDGAAAATIIGAADVYVSDFGNVSFVANRWQRARDVFLLDPEMYSFAYLDPFKVEKLAKTGDNEKRMLVVEWGLHVSNEAAHGLLADLNTAVL